jgi:Tfp pilus assembly protein PilF
MNDLKQYQYKDSNSRVFALITGFLIHVIFGFVFLNTLVELKTVFFYQPIYNFMIVSSLVLHSIGLLAGYFIFQKVKYSRWIIFILSIFIVIIFSLFLFSNSFGHNFKSYILDAFLDRKIYLYSLPGLLPIIIGVVNNNYVKILSGTFFDEYKGTHLYILMIILGLFTGGVLYSITVFDILPYTTLYSLILFVPLSAFFTKLEYNPEPFFAREVHYHPEEIDDEASRNDDIVFNYLNFIYIVVYIVLGLLTLTKHYGDILYIKGSFAGITTVAVLLGFILASLLKKASWHIYSEMIYPFFFMFYFIVLYRFSDSLKFYQAILFFIPIAFIFGLTLYHTLARVIYLYSQKNAHRIITYTVFLVPVPVIIALSYVLFTNRLFFILFYVVTLFNITLPGLHLSQKKHSEYRKGMYLLLFVIVVPLFILMHIYFGIKFDNELFIKYSKNYDVIYDINANADYFEVSSNIYFNKSKVMKISDQNIRNLRRSILSLLLFADRNEDSILFIDGNRKFFENNVYSVFDNAECVDYLDQKQVDFNNLPIGGTKSVVTFKSDIFAYLRDRDRQFEIITDIPNIYDQNFNSFRFTPEYYKRIKKYLTGQSIFVQIFQPKSVNNCLLNNAIFSFRDQFKNKIAFYFGESLVLLGSDEYSFYLNSEKLNTFNTILQENASFRSLFYKDIHAFSYLLDVNLEKPDFGSIPTNYLSMPFLNTCTDKYFSEKSLNDLLETHDRFLELDISRLSEEEAFTLNTKIQEENDVLTYLKKAEKASLEKDYKTEADFISRLQQKADYDFDVRHYINGLVSLKELTYVKAAVEFEDSRDWKSASEIYESILILNEDNFEAHFRLGLIYITLQDIENSFKHFDKALKLEPTNPKVLYQMGVLMYTQGEYRYALEYLQRSRNYDYETPMLMLYTGLAYEQIGKYKNAKEFYDAALKMDPNNQYIRISINRVEQKMSNSQEVYQQTPRENESYVEEGEYIPLPINQNAFDKRLSDEDLKQYAPIDKDGGGGKYGSKYAEDPDAVQPEEPAKEGSIFDIFN